MKIPKPISFNCIKHHLGFIARKVKYYSDLEVNSELIRNELLKIGSSQMDLYTGNLAVLDISNEVLSILKHKNNFEFDEFLNWLHSNNKRYNFLTLSDESIWTVLLGNEKSRYVHIHPAKRSINSTRIRANTLKSAIIYLVESRKINLSVVELELLNQIRAEYLNEPPIKSLSKAKGIINLISIIEERLKQKTRE